VKEARNQSQIFNRKSISRNTTHRQSYHLIQIESVLAYVIITAACLCSCSFMHLCQCVTCQYHVCWISNAFRVGV